MTMRVLHDINGAEVYVNPVYVSAVYKAYIPDANTTGAIIALHGNLVQVRESPGAVYFLLKSLPTT